MKNLQELFIDQLKDRRRREAARQGAAQDGEGGHDGELRKAFEDHLAVTKEQVERLDAVFEEVGARPGRKSRRDGGARPGGGGIDRESPPAEVLDAGLIAAAQRVEHYEIAAYGTLRSYAKTLGHKGAVKLLEKTLKEEEATDKLLSELAEGGVNQDAVAPADEGRGDGEKGLVGKAIQAVAEATGLAAEAPKKPKARKGTGSKK